MTMTRRSQKNGLAILAATSAALAMVESRPAQAGCTKDVECKGERICENGRCVYPPPAVETEGPAPPSAAVAAPAAAAPPDAPSPVAPAVAKPPSPAPTAATLAADVAASPPDAWPDPSGVAWSASWVPRPRRRLLFEVGGYGFGIHAGNAGAFGGGVQAGYRFSRWLGMGAWLEGSGQREQAMAVGSAAYRLYDLGFGPTVWQEAGPIFCDLSVFPELTLLTIKTLLESKAGLEPGKSLTRWGAAAEARFRAGLVLGPLRPFIFVAGSYALIAERLTLDEYPEDSTTLARRDVRLGVGLAYFFGEARWGETFARRPSPGLGE